MKTIFEKYPFIISLLIFTTAYIISRILFFQCPLVEISYDSIEYSNFLDIYISHGKLPPNDYTPLGYPVIIKCLSFVSNSVYAIIGFQMLVGYFACMFVILCVSKFYPPVYCYFSAIALCFFVLSPNNIYFDISILSESIYNSSLLIITGCIIWAIKSHTKKSWLFLSFSLSVPVLFRPNGLFAIILFLFVALYILFNDRKKIYPFITPFLSVWLLISGYSYFANGEFSVVSSTRIKGSTKTILTEHETEKIPDLTFFKRIQIHYNHFQNQRSFYHKLEDLKRKYFDQQYVKRLDETEEFFFPLTEVEKKRAFKEFYNTTNIANLARKQQTITQGFFFKIFDYYQLNIESRFITNCFWQLLMLLAFIYATLIFCADNFKNTTAFILLSVIAINLGTNLIAILSSQRQLPRYEYPAEFLFHLSAVFLIALIWERREHAQ